MTKLYHYIHCPFCIRVRLVLGLLKIPYQSIVVDYDDEETPIKLMGKKMLPILEFEIGNLSNESLEIIRALDNENTLALELLNDSNQLSKLEQLLSKLSSPTHNLCMPYWAYTQEFNENSRNYFEKKKSIKRGPFKKLMARKQEFLDQLAPMLIELEDDLHPMYHSEKLSIFDIMLASHLWGLYILPEFQFTQKLHNYLQTVKDQCLFEYHIDFWN